MNLTDKEIINCLNDTVGKEDIGIYCTDKNSNYTTTIKLTDIIDLINRLQDLNKALINGQETLQKTIVEQKAEIEEWKLEQCRVLHRCSEQIIEAQDEAIKEFWDKLKKEKVIHKNLGEIVYVEDGNILVKELTERKE